MSARETDRAVERAVLRNLLAETLAAYEAALGSPDAARAETPPAAAAVPGGHRPAGSRRRFGMADVKAENTILRRLLTTTSRAYEERLNAFRAEKELVRELLAEMTEAVFLTDASGALTRLNPAAEELTGWTAAEARGRGLGDVLRLVAQGKRVQLDLSPCLDEGRHMALREPIRMVDGNGRTREVIVRAAPIHGGHEVLGAVLVLRPGPG